MNVFVRIVVSLFAAVVAFAVATVGVTAAFESQIEFSLLVGLPVGISAALTALFATYVALWYRDLQGTSTVTPSATRLRWAAIATVVDVVGVTALGVALSLLGWGGLGIAMLIAGLPATLLFAALVGYLVGATAHNGTGGRRSFAG